MKVIIIDYGMSNLDSIVRATEECGGSVSVVDQFQEVKNASHVILPGVGAFRIAMSNIRQRKLDIFLREQVVEKQIPLLGVCLGMQLLATKGFGFHPWGSAPVRTLW